MGSKEDSVESGDDKPNEEARAETDGNDNKQGVEDDEQDLEAIARKQAERCVFSSCKSRSHPVRNKYA